MTNDFIIVTKDKAGYMIDKTVTGTTTGTLHVNMDAMAVLSDVSVTPSNYTNGAMCSYLVTIVTPYSLVVGDQIIITYQNINALISGNAVSTVTNGNLGVQSGSSSFTSSEISFRIGSLSQSTGTFSFTINKVINPPATKSYTVFTSVLIKDSSGYHVMSKPSTVVVVV